MQRRVMGDNDIQRIVEQTVQETLRNLGFTTDDPHEIQADQIYLRKARIGSDEVSKWAKRSALGIVLSAVALAMWEGVKQLIQGSHL